MSPESLFFMCRRILVFFLICALLGDICSGANRTVVGVATQSVEGYVGSAPLSAGSTIYQGERLSAGASGGVWLRSLSARLFVAGRGAVTLQGTSDALSVTLWGGSLGFSSIKASGVEGVAVRGCQPPAAAVSRVPVSTGIYS